MGVSKRQYRVPPLTSEQVESVQWILLYTIDVVVRHVSRGKNSEIFEELLNRLRQQIR